MLLSLDRPAGWHVGWAVAFLFFSGGSATGGTARRRSLRYKPTAHETPQPTRKRDVPDRHQNRPAPTCANQTGPSTQKSPGKFDTNRARPLEGVAGNQQGRCSGEIGRLVSLPRTDDTASWHALQRCSVRPTVHACLDERVHVRNAANAQPSVAPF